MQKEEFRRYVIEIIAYTFSIDIGELSAAMNLPLDLKAENDPPSSPSILTSKEQEQLLHLANLGQKLHSKVKHNEWNTSLYEDCQTLHDCIVVPAQAFNINRVYALDLISSYADHKCDPALCSHTLVSYWSPTVWTFWKIGLEEMLHWTLQSHAKLIGDVSPNEEVRILLGRGIETFQKNKKIGWLKSESFEFPFRDGYKKVGHALVAGRRREIPTSNVN